MSHPLWVHVQAIYDLHPHEIVDALHRFYQGDLSYLRTRMQVLGDGFVGVFVRSGVSGRVFRWSISLDSTFQDVLSRLMVGFFHGIRYI